MQVPVNWQVVLKKVQEVFPGACIAGGALRDLDHERHVKDVDIFCPVSEESFVDVESIDEKYYSMLVEKFPLITLKAVSTYGRSDLQRQIYAVYNVTDDTGMVYEIIIIVAKDEVAIIEMFDLSICQIGYDGQLIYRTKAYDDGKLDKVIRVMNVNRCDRQNNRMDRMLEKYPDYTGERLPDDEFYQL